MAEGRTSTRQRPPLLPEPRQYGARKGRFRLRDGLPIVLPPQTGESGEDDARVLASAISLQAGLRASCDVELPIESHARPDGIGPCVELAHGAATGIAGDAHRLDIDPERVRVRGAGPAGLRYGVETLTQLARAARGKTLAACRIEDSPDFALRGIMLDVSRGKVPSEATLRGLVDLCVRLKLNVLMLYTEHTFQYRRHPKIGSGCSPLVAQTLRRLDAYAAERFVDLVPTLQSLGHMEHILALPEYAKLSESEAGWTVSPADPGTYALLGDLYDEYLPNFRSRFFNANCDEPFDLGSGRSKAREEELGKGGVFLEHVRRVRDMAAKHGKRTMIWGDVVHQHPERVNEIDRDLVMLDWWYEAELDFDRVSVFADAGIEFAVCPGTSSWNCLFPRVENSLLNIERWADAGRRHGALGLINTDWGDFGHYNLQGNSFLAYAWGAQHSWSGATDPERFDRAFARELFGDARGDAARLYRELGAIHDAGFCIFNGSSLQYLFFDDLDAAYFLDAAKKGALARCERALVRAQTRLERTRRASERGSLALDEIGYAIDASRLAVRKSQAALEWMAWRRKPERLRAAERRRLARRLAALADEQVALGRQLRRLWRARSAISNFELTQRRLRRSVNSLRKAARRLEANRPGAAPPPHPGFTPRGVMNAVREGAGMRVRA